MSSDVNVSELMQMFRAENGIANMMKQPVYPKVGEAEPSVSQAEVVADLFNVARLDIKLMAEGAGVDMSIERMTPETAAVLIQGLIKRQSFELIDRFNDLEHKRQQVILALHGEERLVEHIETKHRVAYSQHDPGHPDAPTPEAEADDVAQVVEANRIEEGEDDGE